MKLISILTTLICACLLAFPVYAVDVPEQTDIPETVAKAATVLLIDNAHKYANMQQSYAQGYEPVIDGNDAVIVLGTHTDSDGDEHELYLAEFRLALRDDRMNGSWPVLLETAGSGAYTVYVNITDGKDPNADEPMPAAEPEPIPEPQPEQKEEPVVLMPKILVQSVAGGSVQAGETAELHITLKNTSRTEALQNLTLTASAAATLTAFADTDESSEAEESHTIVSGDYEYSTLIDVQDTSHKAAQIEYYVGKETDLKVPTEIDGIPVVSLGDYAYVSCDTLKTVTIPATIEKIGTFAFAECTSVTDYFVEEGSPILQSKDGVLYSKEGDVLQRYPCGRSPETIEIEEGIEELGNSAFVCCRRLTTVKLPESLNYIGISAFSGCDHLTDINIPNSVTEIGAFAFNDCKMLKKVTLPAKLTAIGNAAFASTAIDQITIPDSCMTIGQQAFANTALRTVTIPSSVTEIGPSAFGWKINGAGDFAMDRTFTIRGYANSAAQEYASDDSEGNDFIFVNLGTEQISQGGGMVKNDTQQQEQQEETSGTSTGRIIGISACGVLMLGIIIAAIVSGKGGKKKSDKPAAETEDAEDGE